MDAAAIEAVVAAHGAATANARRAGLDAVEILAGQGYGIHQFLSPLSNRRRDGYGGPLESRLKLLLEVVAEARREAGPGLALGVRLNADDGQPGGLGLVEAGRIAAALEAGGQVDYLSVSAGTPEHRLFLADMGYPRALLVPLAAELRSSTRLPLLAVCRIKDPEEAEAILASGAADLIGLNRALIADPELPLKARQGRGAEIRPCIGCNQGCLQREAEGFDLSCTVNPSIGSELAPEISPASRRRRRVLVVGAGPAGLETARIAAQRGHDVLLLERSQTPGGQLAIAARARLRQELGELIRWELTEIARLRVELRLESVASLETVAGSGADAVVLATGSRPLRTGFSAVAPDLEAIPGAGLPHVLTAPEVLESETRARGRVAVLEDDPHFHAVTAALELAQRGHETLLITRHAAGGAVVGDANRGFWYRRLFEAGVEMLANTWVRRIEPGRLEAFNVYSGRGVEVGAVDTVVLATGAEAEDSLFRELRSAGVAHELHRVGDCLAPRRLDQAIWDAQAVAGKL